MTIEEFSRISDVAPRTIEKKLFTIKGVEYSIPDGSRWRYNLGNAKLKDMSERRYHLLKAIDQLKYIDHEMLLMDAHSFNALVDELESYELIVDNGSSNPYGTNKYITTIQYEELKNNKKCILMKNIAEYMGTFTGAMLNQMC